MHYIVLFLWIVCAFYMLVFALRPQRTPRTRALSFAAFLLLGLVLPFVTRWGLVATLIWGGICWSDARAERI